MKLKLLGGHHYKVLVTWDISLCYFNQEVATTSFSSLRQIHGMSQGFCGFLLRLDGGWGCGEGAVCMARTCPGFGCVLFCPFLQI